MRLRIFVLFVLVGLVFSAHTFLYGDDGCKSPALLHQAHDEATIQRLEDAWSAAYSTGDVDFERCLLLPGYTEVKRNGKLSDLTEELSGAAKNKGGKYSPSGVKPEVLMYGDVAVAYGRYSFSGAGGKQITTRSADVYSWKDGGWHVIYAQQTPADAN